MSANRLKNPKKKLDDILSRKEQLTPKSTKANKISPAYQSFRGGITLKTDLNNKLKQPLRPSTSKHGDNSLTHTNNFFPSRQKTTSYSSTKKFTKGFGQQTPSSKASQLYTTRRGLQLNNSQQQYQYQPRSKSKSPIKQPDQIIRTQLQLQYPQQNTNQNRGIIYFQNKYQKLPHNMQQIQNFQPAKHSQKSTCHVRSYGASTNQGPVRDYNEDRVAIILNIQRPQNYPVQKWKKSAYFGVFDGHGGVDCSDFLRDNLHIYISRQQSFPSSPTKAIINGFQKAQKTFCDYSKTGKLDRSGSCAVVALIYDKTLWIANVGDSRAIMSINGGKKGAALSLDHKASQIYQQKRIIQNGGKIYQTKLQHANPNLKIFYQGQDHAYVLGPHRVFPGRLSVTRTFGDIEAKLPQLKGNPKGVICQPQIVKVQISEQTDFVVLASDGIFDKISNNQLIQIVWETFERDNNKFKNIHQFVGLAVQNIMKLSFHNGTLDNITVVLIALQGLQKHFEQKMQKKNQQISSKIIQNRPKISSKYQSQFQRRFIGRSKSPITNGNGMRTQSFYRN